MSSIEFECVYPLQCDNCASCSQTSKDESSQLITKQIHNDKLLSLFSFLLECNFLLPSPPLMLFLNHPVIADHLLDKSFG